MIMRALSAITALTLLSGCAEHRLVVPRPNPTGEPQLINSAALAFGLGQKRTVAGCRSKVDGEIVERPDCHIVGCNTNLIDEVRVKQNLGQSLVSLVTLGFYMPTTIEYVCANVPSDVATPND
jgi:hypothetical protein